MVVYCNVRQCRFPTTHVTMGHQCGRCNRYGHGQRECGNSSAMDTLYRTFGGDTIPTSVRCTRADCCFTQLHTLEGHKCNRCDRVGSNCVCVRDPPAPPDLVLSNVCCPHCKQASSVNLDRQVYTDTPCAICFEDTSQKVIFERCAHALICRQCAMRIANTQGT